MTSFPKSLNTGSRYLWITPPYRDETNSSVLDRAAVFHGLPRKRLLSELLPERQWWGHLPDVDYGFWHDRVHDALCQALRLRPEDIGSGLCEVPSECLRPCARSAYCPLCFAEDLRHGRTPHFRWQWSQAYVTLCPLHGAPLCNWRKLNNQQRILPRVWTVAPRLEDMDRCAWFIEDVRFAEQALRDLDRPESPLWLVHHLQSQALNLNRAPGCSHRNHASVNWEMLNLAIVRGAAWRDGGETPPLASELRPRDELEGLFGDVPEKDWRRQPRSALRGFYAQRLVSWRRTTMWFAAAHIKRCMPP